MELPGKGEGVESGEGGGHIPYLPPMAVVLAVVLVVVLVVVLALKIKYSLAYLVGGVNSA